jgi:multidrug efflux system membrane fusion protein
VDFDNRNGEFIPGSFVNVSLLIPAKSYVEVPAGALVMREGKRMVAVVDADSRIKLTPINVAGTDGKVIRIESGLEENARVVLGLPNTVSDGSKITAAVPPGQVASPVAPPPSGTAGPPGTAATPPAPVKPPSAPLR